MRRESRFFLKIEHINELLKDIFIPRVVRIAQRFERPFIAGIEAEFLKNIRNSGLLKAIHPGMSVAIGVGSRGIANQPLIVRLLVRELRVQGATPFIFPAMVAPRQRVNGTSLSADLMADRSIHAPLIGDY